MDYTKGKELLKDFNKIFTDKRAVSKIISFLGLIQIVLYFCILFVHYWNVFEYINVPLMPLFDNEFKIILHNYTFGSFVFITIYYIFIRYFLEKLIINLKVYFEIQLFPLWHTIEDFFGIIISFIIMLFFTNCLIEYIHGYEVLNKDNKLIFVLYFYLLLFKVFAWLYVKNESKWISLEKKYTPYFDCEGKRIPEDARVIYNGKLYKIFLKLKNAGNSVDNKEWYLSDKMFGSTADLEILLENAVKDEKGKIKIYKFGMGEEN